ELVPYSLNFGFTSANLGSRTLTTMLTNTGPGALSISSISVTGTNPTQFSQTNTCGTSIGSGLSCTITVTFRPKAVGSFTANVTVSDSSTDSPQQVTLTGTGVARKRGYLQGAALQAALT